MLVPLQFHNHCIAVEGHVTPPFMMMAVPAEGVNAAHVAEQASPPAVLFMPGACFHGWPDTSLSPSLLSLPVT